MSSKSAQEWKVISGLRTCQQIGLIDIFQAVSLRWYPFSSTEIAVWGDFANSPRFHSSRLTLLWLLMDIDIDNIFKHVYQYVHVVDV
jgi:hypothetical protein